MSEDFPDIVEGVFPSGHLHLISGSRGAGKSSWEIWMEKSVLSGQPFMGRKTWRPPFWGVLIFDRSSADRLQMWERAGMEPLLYYSLTDDPTLTPEKLLHQTPAQSLTMLSNAIDQMEPPCGSCITIDVANFFAGDANLSYRSGFAHGWAIAKMAHRRQLTIFALMHGGKQKAGHQYLRLTDRTIASTGFMGTANAFAYITTREETSILADPQVMDMGSRTDLQVFEWEPRRGPTERFILGRNEAGLFVCLSSPNVSQDRNKCIEPAVQERLESILQFIRISEEDELEGIVIKAHLGIPKATFSRDVNTLVDSGKLMAIRRGRGMFYRIPDEPAES